MGITPRDRMLFRHIADFGMLTTKQINTKVFGGIATTTVLRRLRHLEKRLLIKRLHGLESQEVLWIITEKASHFSDGGEHYKRLWNKNLLEHDFKLLCLRLLLEKEGVAISWEPEHKIRFLVFQKYQEEAKNKLIPDGIMLTETLHKRVSVAVELELTLKNKERLRDVLRRYCEKKDLGYLWYVCGSKMVANSIVNLWNEVRGNSPLKLKVSLLTEVMKQPTAHWPAQGVSRQRLKEGSSPIGINPENQKRSGLNFSPPIGAVSPDLPLSP